jgi:hypothetical protein
MESLNLNAESIAYLRSESEFNHARLRAFVELVMGLITHHDMHLLSFHEVREKLRLRQSIYKGLQDVPVTSIVGSTGRYEDFTRHFLPKTSNKREKERWRNIYTLAVTGKGFPPIEVYKVDQAYFVKDGNHRVSVARELGWETIQAHVTELPSAVSLDPQVEPRDLLIKEEVAYFLEQTQLDQTRPDSTQHINFSESGGYDQLLYHIETHRYLLTLAQSGQPDRPPISFAAAAADWYDRVYQPIIEAVRQTEIVRHFPGRSASDLYRWLIEHQAELREQHDLALKSLPQTAQDFLDFLET